jgi:acetyltransferase-like isoleucine patch superfamily enzyme
MKIYISSLFILKYLKHIIYIYSKKYNLFKFSIKNNFSCSLDVEFTGSLNNFSVGKNTRINSFANFRFKKGKISIGENCLIARNVTIITQTYNIDNEVKISLDDTIVKDVSIGNNVWVGSNTVIMPGTNIGNGAVIGSGSVVTKCIPDNEIWGGVPARKIRARRI